MLLMMMRWPSSSQGCREHLEAKLTGIEIGDKEEGHHLVPLFLI